MVEVWRSKDLGGLGIQNTESMDQALICKWQWKLYIYDGAQAKILRNKYIKNQCVSGVKHKQGDS